MLLRIALFLVLFPIGLAAQTQLSAESEISVLTMGPDQDELYSAFWHSAFRVNDPVNQIDRAYNYGIFDFDNPNFYSDFAKGHLLYRLGAARFDRFYGYYVYSNRSIEEQVLDLDHDQKQAMFEFLERNNLPENRYYFYDYLFDNCATKIRDVLVEVLGDQVVFDENYVVKESSFRQLIDECTHYQPWGDFGIDLGLGSKIDRIATPLEHMFLPYYVRDGFAQATVRSQDGARPLVREVNLLFQPEPQEESETWLTPGLVFWVLLILIFIWSFKANARMKTVLDFVLFSLVGLFGLVLALIWFATDHYLASNNYNLLWMHPLYLLVAPLLLFKRKPKLLSVFFLVNSIILAGVIIGWFWIPQELHWASFPLILGLGLRSFLLGGHSTSQLPSTAELT